MSAYMQYTRKTESVFAIQITIENIQEIMDRFGLSKIEVMPSDVIRLTYRLWKDGNASRAFDGDYAATFAGVFAISPRATFETQYVPISSAPPYDGPFGYRDFTWGSERILGAVQARNKAAANSNLDGVIQHIRQVSSNEILDKVYVQSIEHLRYIINLE